MFLVCGIAQTVCELKCRLFSFRIRRSTWNRFQSIATKNTPLSELLRKATEEDPVAPVLSDPHFRAIDRRMKIAIDTIKKCIKSHGEAGVLFSEDV